MSDAATSVGASDRIAWLAFAAGLIGAVVYFLPYFVLDFSGPENPYEPINYLGPMLVVGIAVVCFLISTVCMVLGFVTGVAVCIRVIRGKSARGSLTLGGIGMLPALAIVAWGQFDAPSRQEQTLEMRKEMEAELKKGNLEKANELKNNLKLRQIEDEIIFLERAIKTQRYREGNLPEKIVPDLIPPEIEMKTWGDVPHDPFGEIVNDQYEYHFRPIRWIIHRPAAPPQDRYITLGGEHVSADRLRGDHAFFEPRNRSFYRYAGKGDRFYLLSRGPDEDWDVSESMLHAWLESESTEDRKALSYDPTNGSTSGGDLIFDYLYVEPR